MICDRTHFLGICRETMLESHSRTGIGTYKEFSLHSVLKRHYCGDKSFHEIPCCGYIADIKQENRIIEIQTSGFYTMKKKLEAFLEDNSVTVVYPVIERKIVSWIEPGSGEITASNKSPKRLSAATILTEIYGVRELILNGKLSFDAVILEATDYKLLDGFGKDKKRHATKIDRVPTDLIDIIHLTTKEDYKKLIPYKANEEFAAEDFAKACRMNKANAYKALKTLSVLGIVEDGGMNGRRKIYRYI